MGQCLLVEQFFNLSFFLKERGDIRARGSQVCIEVVVSLTLNTEEAGAFVADFFLDTTRRAGVLEVTLEIGDIIVQTSACYKVVDIHNDEVDIRS